MIMNKNNFEVLKQVISTMLDLARCSFTWREWLTSNLYIPKTRKSVSGSLVSKSTGFFEWVFG